MITELKIGFLPPDLTLVQSELVVLGVLGYSRTQHGEFYDVGVLSVSGYCHLGIIHHIIQDTYRVSPQKNKDWCSGLNIFTLSCL